MKLLDATIILIAFFSMIIQFSGVVVPIIVYMLSLGMNIYQITLLWLASHTIAITISYLSTRLVNKYSLRISSYLNRKTKELENYIGSLGLLLGLILFNFSVWLYISVPIMVLMGINWKKIYLSVSVGNIFYYLLMVGSIFWLYTIISNVLVIILFTLAIAFATSIIVYQIISRINGKRFPEVEEVEL
ncbi:MAG: hypothetical protein ACETWM_01165 [Candidatus Lokiarchaeia archaeon]